MGFRRRSTCSFRRWRAAHGTPLDAICSCVCARVYVHACVYIFLSVHVHACMYACMLAPSQWWGSTPPCNANSTKCLDPSTGIDMCCTANCEVLGIGIPVWSLLVPENPLFGGLSITHRGVPPPYVPRCDCDAAFMAVCSRLGSIFWV